ncbi:MAG: succinate dehydrogenase cytochrome b subunit [Muribaculaceae bacterium]|nr:succinate dehydrogenase cytochrome b subunit [Muribaculaceae bacterium]
MWLTSSSIGRKFVMAITGACLVLFVTFHVLMNSVALLWPAAYNVVCEFLGANWYALVATVGLAALFIIHIIYAVWLTVQNRAARGADRYAVNTRPAQVEWASKNMLVLGIVILAFLVVHLIQFWAKMQLQEILHHEMDALPMVGGAPAIPVFGTLLLQLAFESWWTPVVYIIGFIALWFHMNHGFWSMFHTIGWDNNKWIERLKCIGCWWTSIVIALFIAQAVLFTVQAHNKFFLTDESLQEQYTAYWEEQAQALLEEFQAAGSKAIPSTMPAMEQQAASQQFFAQQGEYFANKANLIAEYAAAQVPGATGQHLQQMKQFAEFVGQRAEAAKASQASNETETNN